MSEPSKERRGFYDLLQSLARSYLDLQQLRIAVEHRMRKMLEKYVMERYCAENKLNYEETLKDFKETEGRGEKVKKLKAMTKFLEEKKFLEPVKQELKNDPIHQKLAEHRRQLFNEEKRLLSDSQSYFENTKVWEWCNGVSGLGPVAGMTFFGYINPFYCTTAGKFWAYIGLIPEAKLTAGEKAHYNPELKGRFYVIAKNVVMAKDNYYKALFDAKKLYLTGRPDFVEQREAGKKGVKGHVNSMAARWLCKLIISHAVEIMRESEGLEVHRHHGHIPPKPEDPAEVQRILAEQVPRLIKGVIYPEEKPPQEENQTKEPPDSEKQTEEPETKENQNLEPPK